LAKYHQYFCQTVSSHNALALCFLLARFNKSGISFVDLSDKKLKIGLALGYREL